MDADRRREQQQHDEREARQPVAEKVALIKFRDDVVPANVGAHDPEIN